jgi:hypothetical protein
MRDLPPAPSGSSLQPASPQKLVRKLQACSRIWEGLARRAGPENDGAAEAAPGSRRSTARVRIVAVRGQTRLGMKPPLEGTLPPPVTATGRFVPLIECIKPE